MGWLGSYEYRKKVTIQGQSGVGSNYAVHLRIGSSSGGDFHLEGHCQNFPHDIRFTKDDGETELYYWIEDLSADPIDVWVKIPDSLDTNIDIYVYYGMSGVQTTRDGDNTFDFFDDFTGNSVDSEKWDVSGSEILVVDGNLKIKPGTGSEALVSSKDTFNMPFQFKCRGFVPSGDGRYGYHGMNKLYKDWGYGDDNAICYCRHVSEGRLAATAKTESGIKNVQYYANYWDLDTWSIFWIKAKDTSQVKIWLPSISYWGTLDQYIADVAFNVKLGVWMDSGQSTDAYSEYDWVFVTKYHDPEPSFSTASSEEHLITLSGSAVSSATTQGTFSKLCAMVGFLSGLSVPSGVLTSMWSLSGQSPAQSTAVAPLAVAYPLSGSASAQSAVSSILKPCLGLIGTIPCCATTCSVLKPLRSLFGTSAANATALPPLTLLYSLSSTIPCVSTLTSTLFRVFSMRSLSPGSSTLVGSLARTRQFSGTVSSLVTTTSSLHQSFALTGTSTPYSTTTGSLSPITFLSGTAPATSWLVLSLRRARSLAGSSPCVSSCSGFLSHIFLLKHFGKPYVPLSCRSFRWRGLR